MGCGGEDLVIGRIHWCKVCRVVFGKKKREYEISFFFFSQKRANRVRSVSLGSK